MSIKYPSNSELTDVDGARPMVKRQLMKIQWGEPISPFSTNQLQDTQFSTNQMLPRHFVYNLHFQVFQSTNQKPGYISLSPM